MKPVSRPLLNRLLSGGEGLSAADKEDVLANVLAKQAPRARRWTWVVGGLGLSAVAASLVAVFSGALTSESDFSPRGVAAPDFELACLSADATTTCRAGSRLLFKVSPGGARALSVLAIAPDHRLIWLLDGTALTSLPSSGVLPEASVLGPELGTGVFEVVAVFSAEVLEKAQVRALAEGAQVPAGGSVLKRTLTIEP